MIFLAFSLLTWGVGEGMFFIFQPLYLEELGANPVLIGTILGGMGITMTIAHIPAGYLADRIGRRPLIWIAWLTGACSAWIMAMARTLPVFVVGLLCYGLTAFVSSPLSSYVTAARGKMSVSRALTLISATYNTGALIGPLLGGLIGHRLGLSVIYRISASIFLVSLVIILFIRKQPVEPKAIEQHENGSFFNRKFIVFLVIIFLAMFAMYLPQPLSQNFLQNEREININQIGVLGSITGLGLVILNLTLGSLAPRVGLLLGQGLVALYAVLLWQGNGFLWYALAYFMIGGYRVARFLTIAQTRNLVHGSRMGLAYGIMETAIGLAIILASPLAGYIYDIQPDLVYIISLCLIVISLFASMTFLSEKNLSNIPPEVIHE